MVTGVRGKYGQQCWHNFPGAGFFGDFYAAYIYFRITGFIYFLRFNSQNEYRAGIARKFRARQFS